MVLDKALNTTNNNIAEALPIYSNIRAKEARALVEISRKLDGGFLTFILPLILDSLFSKALPQLFSPNTISLLQSENLTFTQVQNKKRRDRVLQCVAVAVAFGAIFNQRRLRTSY